MHKKCHLPSKICAYCQKPFVWRKRWRLNWQHVKYCSRRCASANPASISQN
ncbi:DUF2256 domain-containing protein [Vibrio sp. ZSDZ65]|uniref:DUF2256 domain-containing protein n=1 Tax=Vibrio qingdaonensis TaxID=2829491 RepID=A0A9X3CMA3_9VIBR|nr:DUF2256 domain-containing protein [Vibrio qingdaonensis]MCW8345910.1 DUF2256 domain-containing protein [Vibrio qingdaonensis]